MKGSKRKARIALGSGDDVMALVYLMQGEGLLAFEEATEDIGSDLLKSLILLIVDGIEPEHITEIAANQYWINMPHGVQAMIHYMYIRGIIGIGGQESREVLTEILLSLMPAVQRQEYRALLNQRSEESERGYRKP